MEQHNMEAANGDHSFTMGYNAYSDYSADEINSIMNGLTIQVKQDKMMRPMFRSDKELKDLPNSINWKEQVRSKKRERSRLLQRDVTLFRVT